MAKSSRQGDDLPPEGDDIYEAALRAPDEASLASAIRDLGLDVDHQHPAKRESGAMDITGFLALRQVEALRERGWEVELGRNITEVGRERQKEVGVGDRFEGGRVKPTGLGRKPEDPY
jgi:hypothetical protein